MPGSVDSPPLAQQVQQAGGLVHPHGVEEPPHPQFEEGGRVVDGLDPLPLPPLPHRAGRTVLGWGGADFF